MKLKYLVIPATTFCLLFSGPIFAKKPEGKGNPHHGGSDARRENSNRQSDEYSRRGKDRAEERHRLKEEKKYKHKKDKKFKHKKDKHSGHDRYDNDHDRYEKRRDNDKRYHDKKSDRYERQRNEERYRNNPIDSTIDRNINGAKSQIDSIHRKAIESIDDKTREFTGAETRRENSPSTKPWWSWFGNE